MSIVGAVSAVSTGGGIANMIIGIFPPLQYSYNKWANRHDPELLPTIGDLIEMRARGLLSQNTYEIRAAENGFDRAYAAFYWEAAKRILDANDYITLWRRGAIDRNELDAKFELLHFKEDEREAAIRVSEFYPSPQDLITFAVREVYSPDVLQLFGQMEDLPQIFLQEAAKVGLSPEQATNYWAAHWQLPSTMQGFEMLHRRIIDEETLRVLLRALDVMPYWRDKLIQLSYNPLTRVDVRRMYGLGVLDKDGVYNSYLDGGYSPENAKLMTDFTVKYESDETTGISRAAIMDAYNKDIVTYDEMAEWFDAFGYTDVIKKFWLDTAEYNKALAEIESSSTELINQYRRGIKTAEQVRTELQTQNLPSAYVNATVSKMVSEESKKVVLPTRSDIDNWLSLDIIDEKQYADYLKKRGYREIDIVNYLTEYTLERSRIKPRFLPEAVYQRWLSSGIIGIEYFRDVLTAKGVSEYDIDSYIMEVMEAQSETTG